MDKIEMSQEEKQLLLKKDIYARLPYGEVICGTKSSNYEPTFYATIGNSTYLLRYIEHDDLKPYLRPMSSMTDEEETLFRCELPAIAKTDAQLVAMRMELFLKGHLDFNHLIEKGLALVAPEGMY